MVLDIPVRGHGELGYCQKLGFEENDFAHKSH